MEIDIRIKRIYEPRGETDGYRVLVDRLWPRGVTKQAARLDYWAKEFAPSNMLRKWFHEDKSRRQEFVAKYENELENQTEAIKEFLTTLETTTVTLLTATKDVESGHVPILARFLRSLIDAS